MKRLIWFFVRAGRVERALGGFARYRWLDGWSRDGVEVPPVTRREARDQAQYAGAIARFVETIDEIPIEHRRPAMKPGADKVDS